MFSYYAFATIAILLLGAFSTGMVFGSYLQRKESDEQWWTFLQSKGYAQKDSQTGEWKLLKLF